MRDIDNIEKDLRAVQKNNVIQNLLDRRVPHIFITYVITSSSVILFLDWLVQRYYLNAIYVDILLISIITLIPSIIMVSYFHGKPGKDEWKRTELVGIPVNLIITFICIFIFISPDLLSGDEDRNNKIFKTTRLQKVQNVF